MPEQRLTSQFLSGHNFSSGTYANSSPFRTPHLKVIHQREVTPSPGLTFPDGKIYIGPVLFPTNHPLLRLYADSSFIIRNIQIIAST
jgi:hypothetical protein